MAQNREHGTVFFTAHFFLHGDEGFEIENPGSESAAQIQHRAVRGQIAMRPAISDAAKDIERTKTCCEKIMPSRGEVLGLWFQTTLRLRPINCLQFPKSGSQACEVVRFERVHDIEIQGADRRAVQNGAHGANNDVINRVTIQRLEQVAELKCLSHGR